MTSLLLVIVVCSSPGIRLVDTSTGRIRLVSDDDEEKPNLDKMTRVQLVEELHRLEDARPGLGGPIAMTVVGAALLFPGAFFGIYGFGLAAAEFGMKASAGTAVGYLLMMGGGVFVLVGLILAIVGVVKLIKRFGARRTHGEEVDALRQRIDTLNTQPPPLPVPPPEANLVVPAPMRTVMTF